MRSIAFHPAPGDLELVRAFLNTVRLQDGRDAIGDPERLGAWLRARALLAPDAAPVGADVEIAGAVREALRDLAGANAGSPVATESSACLDAVAETCRLRPRFEPGGGIVLAPAVGGVAGAMGRLLGIVVAHAGRDEWARLKICRDPTCRWAFWDATRNRSGVWCDMAACGSRAKARRYARRRAAQRRRGSAPA